MRIFLVFFFIFIIGCATHPKPDWTFRQPISEGYWFGIGIIDKNSSTEDCREEARNVALSEISSQISVKVSGSFKRIIEENDLSLKDFSKSITKIYVEKSLPKVEYIDYYDFKNQCGMLARLSQFEYYKTLSIQRKNAIEIALGLLEKAESNFSFKSYYFINDAMVEVLPFLDIPIEEEYPKDSGSIINLPSYLRVLANDYINRLKIIPNDLEIEIKRGFTRGVELDIQVVDEKNNTPINNIPIMSYIENEFSYALSDSNGRCVFSLPEITNQKSIQHITYEVNKIDLYKNIELFGNLTNVKRQSVINVNSPLVYINIQENFLGKISSNPQVYPTIADFFSRHYSANFIDNNQADLIIKGFVNTRAVSDLPNEYGIFQVFGDLTISIIDNISKKEIITKSYNNIQGSNFLSNHEAAYHSLRKISNKIEDEFLPELLLIINSL